MTPPSLSTPRTYSGSSTIDTQSESSPRKTADLSEGSLEGLQELSSPVREGAVAMTILHSDKEAENVGASSVGDGEFAEGDEQCWL